MKAPQYTVLAYAIGLVLLWGYALWTLLALRAERRRAERSGRAG